VSEFTKSNAPRPGGSAQGMPNFVTPEQYSRTKTLVRVMAAFAVVCGIGFVTLMTIVFNAQARDRAEVIAQGQHYDPSIYNGFLPVVPCVFAGLTLCVVGLCSLLACGVNLSDLRDMEMMPEVDAQAQTAEDAPDSDDTARTPDA
jgi:hypothetical protein